MKQIRDSKPRPPLAAESLERLALFYVGRYATTRAKLRGYLERKVKERGWEGTRPPEIEALVERLAELGYVDDRAFAASRSASLQRRGFGEHRIGQALRAAGIEADDAALAREAAEEHGWSAALRFARRKRLGPYAPCEPSREDRQKAFAAMLRAGHRSDLVRRVLEMALGEEPDDDPTI